MTQDLDALPLPERTYATDTKYNYGDEDIRAARREGYELAMSKASNGVELMEHLHGQAKFMTIHDPSDPDGGHWYSPDAVREIVAAELRKAQEGREPVGKVWLVVTGETYEGQETYTRHEEFVPFADAECLYTSPPPKSDEVRDALTNIERQTIQALQAHKAEPDILELADAMAYVGKLAKDALAAQQKGGAV